jgi:hypothetical protein
MPFAGSKASGLYSAGVTSAVLSLVLLLTQLLGFGSMGLAAPVGALSASVIGIGVGLI